MELIPRNGAKGSELGRGEDFDVVQGGVIDPAPQDVNPRPSTNPGEPYLGGWPSN